MDNEKLMEQIKMWEPLISKEANKYSNNICGVEDLKSEGILGIISGLDKYDESKGSISTYMYKCISNAIRCAAITSSFSLSVPSGSIRILKEQSKYHAIPLQDTMTETKVYSSITEDVKDIIRRHDKDNIAYMYFIEQQTYKEISLVTGISQSTISRFINKIRQIIKEKLVEI